MGGVSLVKWLPWWLSGKESASQCRRKEPLEKEPAPIFLPGKSHGQRSLVGYSPQGRKRIRHDLATKQQVSLYNSYLEIIQFASKGHMGEKLFSDCYLQT